MRLLTECMSMHECATCDYAILLSRAVWEYHVVLCDCVNDNRNA